MNGNIPGIPELKAYLKSKWTLFTFLHVPYTSLVLLCMIHCAGSFKVKNVCLYNLLTDYSNFLHLRNNALPRGSILIKKKWF